MKRLFYIVILFFALTLSLLVEQRGVQAQPIYSGGSIQNVKKETVILVSNNILNGEITSYQQKKNTNFSGITNLLANYLPVNNLFDHNKPILDGCFIHNYSTNKEKTHQIRAP